jgi:A/G-specific adenine glycosylase
MEQVEVTRVWCEAEGAVLLRRGEASARRLADLHELPTAADVGLTEHAAQRGRELARRKRGITRFQITETIFAYDADRAARERLSSRPNLHWIALGDLDRITLSGPHRRWATEILASRAPGQRA